MSVTKHGFQWWPTTLRWRLFVILFAGLATAYILSFTILVAERNSSADAVMLGTLESDLATSIAVLDRLPAAERPHWLDRLSRGGYRLFLGQGLPGVADLSGRGREIASRINQAAGGKYPIAVKMIPGDRMRLQAHLTLSDGAPLTIDITPRGVIPLAGWSIYIFATQMFLLILCAWLAVHIATQPLAALAAAADALDFGKHNRPLDESGPSEVADAARAFNAMRERIALHLEERVQMLAAISHDLQTPITRMRLRADMADEGLEKEKLVSDLKEIERLVQDGIAYARSSHGKTEPQSRIDLASFIASIAYDYQDTGQNVRVIGTVQGTVMTKPHALRRILVNYIDNALKFAGAAELYVNQSIEGTIVITVADEGPGIPSDQLEAALLPFYRLETSRNRQTGGTGLGLAIAQQLTDAIGGAMRLYNRKGGGLAAEVRLPD